MKKLLIALLMLAPLQAWGECSITWSANDASEEVTEYRLYQSSDGGSTFLRVGDAITGLTTSCSSQGITEEVGLLGLTAVNSVGESDRAIATFPIKEKPSRPSPVVIVITQ